MLMRAIDWLEARGRIPRVLALSVRMEAMAARHSDGYRTSISNRTQE